MTEVDIAVVGGGIAGLGAALQAACLGRRCAAFTGGVPGGLLLSIESIQGLPGHPEGIAGYELCPMTQEQAMDAGAQCLPDEAAALVPTGNGWIVRGVAGSERGAESSVRARCVILAPGSRLRELDVPGEQRLAGKGVSHCASCDAPLLRGRAVAVVGGGDAACQEALTLAAHAAEVHLLVRGAALRAQAVWQARIQAQRKIVCHLQVRVEAILGDATVRALDLSGAHADGMSELAVDAVFVYAGLTPNTAFLDGVAPLDAQGRIIVDATLRSPVRGLLAAGNARAGACGQATGAAADGQAAAWAAHRFLENDAWPG